MKDVFSGSQEPGEAKRITQRPLGLVSSYVVEDLPQELDYVRHNLTSPSKLSSRVGILVGSLSSPQIQAVLLDPSKRDLAGLDLKMLEAALTHSEALIPGKLSELVNVFSEKSEQPTGLSYEEIILINPPDDRRTFTRGGVGETEAAFYEGHKSIEMYLDETIKNMRRDIYVLSHRGSDAVKDVAGNTAAIQQNLDEIIGTTHRIGEQNKDHFAVFRQYFGSHPIRGTKGPSGAFTAGVPTLEILLAGEKLPDEYMQYLRANRIYFPRDGRLKLDEARDFAKKGMTLSSLSQRLGNPSELTESINSLGALFRRFRGEHYKAVKNQVPEALSGSIAGSGGEQNPGEFLRDRMKIRHT